MTPRDIPSERAARRKAFDAETKRRRAAAARKAKGVPLDPEKSITPQGKLKYASVPGLPSRLPPGLGDQSNRLESMKKLNVRFIEAIVEAQIKESALRNAEESAMRREDVVMG